MENHIDYMAVCQTSNLNRPTPAVGTHPSIVFKPHLKFNGAGGTLSSHHVPAKLWRSLSEPHHMTTTSLDYYAMEELLTEEERAARDRARQFVQEEAMREIVPCHRAGKFPEHLIPRMGALGFYAPYLKEHGYTGLSHTAYGLIMQELERADSGLRSLASVQGALTIQAIHSFGSPEQHARWLPGLVSGERVGCFALTEHGHGSDPGGMETRATRDGDYYILNGSKCWIGNASIADVKVVWAKDDDGRVGGFVVEKDAPGFRARDIEGKFSLRMSRTSECWFENCRIPAENRLPKASGLRAP